MQQSPSWVESDRTGCNQRPLTRPLHTKDFYHAGAEWEHNPMEWGLDTEYQAVIRRPMVIEFAKW